MPSQNMVIVADKKKCEQLACEITTGQTKGCCALFIQKSIELDLF